MTPAELSRPANPLRDLTAGVVVFLVALPLSLGIALASNPTGMPLVSAFSGLLSGIIGGIIVGLLSGSHTSVSGPAAGLTAVVAAQLALLGSFEAFLLALVLAGLIQIGLGIARTGLLAAFFPSSVIKGLLAAIGVILILKQLPHVFGHDKDPEGEMSFFQPDNRNTFTEYLDVLLDLSPTALLIGILSVAVLLVWDKVKVLKKSIVPSALIVVLLGVVVQLVMRQVGGGFAIGKDHLVDVPIAKNLEEFRSFLKFPDFTQWAKPAIYLAGFTIAIVASLETLLNLQAVDKLDPEQRVSPPNQELIAQGVGNVVAGLIGGIPVTSVIVRSSVNVASGGTSKLSTIVHGVLMLVCVAFLPIYLNMIPLSCLAAILLVTGMKLASPALFKQMWAGGPTQFIPFIVTLLAIVFTDLLIGILIGMVVALSFVLNSNLRRPLRWIMEHHLGGDVMHIELANQVSFLNRAKLEKAFRAVPRGGHVLIDASNTDYIDPDILDLIRDFREQIAPAHGVQVSLRGFRDKYDLADEVLYVDYSTRDLQEQLTPDQILRILLDGNERFRSGQRLNRDLGRQMNSTAAGQHPLAVVLSCIDSRTPAELIFDLGLGDIFSIRVAGNVSSRKILGSMEYGTAVAGAKLVLVVGHTRCGAVGAAVSFLCSSTTPEQATGCQHLDPILNEIQQVIDVPTCQRVQHGDKDEQAAFTDEVARRNVLQVVRSILHTSQTVANLVRTGRIAVVGALYDITSGKVEVLTNLVGEPVAR